MLILTNFERFPAQWTAASGQTGKGEMAFSFRDFTRRIRHADMVMINCDVALTLRLCALFLVCPWLRKPIVAVDFVLRRPKSLSGRMAVLVKRLLLGGVDLFIHYFKDITGYQRFYGIGARRSVFVPFKANLRYRREVATDTEGRYILCLGRSMRDYDTFFEAVRGLPYPAAIPEPDFDQLRIHEARFSARLDQLPPNVERLADEGGEDAMSRMMLGARLVVLPILKTSLCASGISTCLNAMLMKKCVILSEGPGASDIFTDEVLICPQEDATALSRLIRRAWEDDDLRIRTAETGYQYALSLGGEPELRQRVIDAACAYLGEKR